MGKDRQLLGDRSVELLRTAKTILERGCIEDVEANCPPSKDTLTLIPGGH
jgi:hypothetical protein